MANFDKTQVSRRSVLKVGAMAAVAAPFVLNAGRSLAASGDSLSIMLFGPSADVVNAFKKDLLPAFGKDTGIEVSFQQSDWGSGFQKIATAAASGTLADVVMLGGIWTAPLASKSALLPIDSYMAGWADKSNFYDSMIADGSYDGKNYALPLYADTRTALYRKDLLSAAGMGEGDLPSDWDSYRAAAQKVAASGSSAAATPVYWGQDRSIGLQQTYAQLILQAGGSYFGADGSSQFASDQGVAALDYLVSFFKDGLANVNQIYTGAGPNPLVAGASAANFGGFNTITNARANAPDAEKQIVAGTPLAAEKGGTPTTSAWINKLGISAHAKNPDGAWQLIQFLMTRDVAEKLAYLFGGLPARKDLADAKYLEGVSPGFTAASQYVVPQPPSPNMLVIAKEINTAVEKAVRMEAEPKAALSELDARIDQINGR